MSPAHPTVRQLVAAVGQHPQRLELPIDCQLAQAGCKQRDHRDRVRVQRVGLAVVAGVEEPDPGGELRRDVNDPLTGRDQPLGQRTARAVCSLDSPDPLAATSSRSVRIAA